MGAVLDGGTDWLPTINTQIMEQQNQDRKESAGVHVVGHVLIRDVDTKETYVNQRGTAQNIEGLNDEE